MSGERAFSNGGGNDWHATQTTPGGCPAITACPQHLQKVSFQGRIRRHCPQMRPPSAA